MIFFKLPALFPYYGHGTAVLGVRQYFLHVAEIVLAVVKQDIKAPASFKKDSPNILVQQGRVDYPCTCAYILSRCFQTENIIFSIYLLIIEMRYDLIRANF